MNFLLGSTASPIEDGKHLLGLDLILKLYLNDCSLFRIIVVSHN